MTYNKSHDKENTRGMGHKCACKAQDKLHMGQGRCEDLAYNSFLVNTILGFYFGLCILGPVK